MPPESQIDNNYLNIISANLIIVRDRYESSEDGPERRQLRTLLRAMRREYKEVLDGLIDGTIVVSADDVLEITRAGEAIRRATTFQTLVMKIIEFLSKLPTA